MLLSVFRKGMWLIDPTGERWQVIAEHEAVKKRPHAVTILRVNIQDNGGFAALVSEVELIKAGYRTEAVDGSGRDDGD